jgi:hypothetical protein
MKKIFIVALAAIVFTSCQQNANDKSAENSVFASNPASLDAAVMTFAVSSYDFGKIKAGEKVHYDFKFKNTGKTPLIVSNATASCGCTTPDVPKEPIAPGKEAVIKVVFNSTGKMGLQDKVVTVTSNSNPAVNQLHLIGTVQENNN